MSDEQIGIRIDSDESGSSALSQAWLVNRLVARYGSNILGIWFGDSFILNGSNQVTSAISAVGTSTLVAAFGFFLGTSINGRLAVVNATPGAPGHLIKNGLAANLLSVFVVTEPPAMPFSGAQALVDAAYPYAGGYEVALGLNGASGLYEGGGWDHIVDGVNTPNLTPGVRVIECNKPTNDTPNIVIGRTAVAWRGPISFIMALSAVSDATQSADTYADLRRYNRIVTV
jgi:hypothetical protein